MDFMSNKQFWDYLEQELKQPAVETIHYPYRKTTKPKHGMKAKWFRWWYGQCLETHEAFWTMRTDEDFKTLERKGWHVYETEPHDYDKLNILFGSIAQGLQDNIRQLNHKTLIAPTQDTHYPMRVAVHKPFALFDEIEPNPVMEVPEIHHLEWLEFWAEDGRNVYQMIPDRYCFRVAYDGIHDTLHIKYLAR
jgi:hypothetical protein